MIERGAHILAGVSGGADSVCLLLVLKELEGQYGLKISAVHVEHGIRGEESLRDKRFVEELCREQGISCLEYDCDAITYARERGLSLEEGARELRYGFFVQAAKEIGADKIAVAHNQNDCAETLLFHMSRGSGLKGMCGIVPVRDNIIRPLLCVSRSEIETYLAERQQAYCTDTTNRELQYTRNKIRHQVLPVLLEINSGAVEHLYRSTQRIANALELTETLAREAKAICTEGGLLKMDLLAQPLLIQETVVLHLLEELAGRRRNLSETHVEQVLVLFERQVGRHIDLPYGLRARRVYEGIVLEKTEISPKEMELPPEGIALEPGMCITLPETDVTINCCLLEKNVDFYEIPKKRYTKWFDYDKIKNALLLRRRHPGDYFVLDAAGGCQKLKQYFINEKVPGPVREQVLLLAEGAHVLWIVGYRISEAYKVTTETKRILEVQISGGNAYE